MDERPSKRFHTEGNSHHPTAAKLSARERFLKELEQFAEDDEDDRHNAEEQLSPSPAPGAHAATAATSSAHSLFDCEREEEEEVQRAAVRRGPVGLSLLHQMHEQTACPSPGGRHDGQQQQHRKQRTGLQRVETYVPLSSGGFLESEGQPSAEGSSELPRPIVVGDIVCRRPKLFQLPGNSGAEASGTAAPTAMAASKSATAAGADAQQNNSGSGSSSAALAKDRVKGFKSESALSKEEKEYGKHIQVDMVGTLLEVTRVDAQQKQIEVVSLDGKKEKLKFADVRFAGYVEQRLHRQWRADPSTRPVETLTAPPISVPPSTTSDPQQKQQQQQQPSSSPPSAAVTATATTTSWWVLPRLVVRVMVEGSSRYGAKAVVLKVARKEEKMRLLPLELHSGAAGGTAAAAQMHAHVFDVVGCANVDTVAPKKGEQGLMVKGEHRGELVTVLRRVRQQGDGAEIAQIEVQCARTSEVWQVAPEEVCMILAGSGPTA